MSGPRNLDLAVAILKSGKTKSEIAEEAGIERGTLRRVLCAKGTPSLRTVQRIAMAIGVSAVELGFFPPPPNPVPTSAENRKAVAK